MRCAGVVLVLVVLVVVVLLLGGYAYVVVIVGCVRRGPTRWLISSRPYAPTSTRVPVSCQAVCTSNRNSNDYENIGKRRSARRPQTVQRDHTTYIQLHTFFPLMRVFAHDDVPVGRMTFRSFVPGLCSLPVFLNRCITPSPPPSLIGCERCVRWFVAMCASRGSG
jgi:hypothetical protein